MRAGTGSYRAKYVLDQNSRAGSYRIEIRAEDGGASGTGFANFEVAKITAIAIDPSEITLPAGMSVQYEIRAATEDVRTP